MKNKDFKAEKLHKISYLSEEDYARESKVFGLAEDKSVTEQVVYEFNPAAYWDSHLFSLNFIKFIALLAILLILVALRFG